MTPEIYWVREIEPIRLALMPRPRAGDWLTVELSGWHRAGLRTVACLLEPHEVHDLALTEEQALCEALGIELLSLPIPDGGVPASVPETVALVEALLARLRRGVGVGVHCHAGIGRSGLISACVLLKLGVPLPEVFPMLCRARDLSVPGTSAQAEWVKVFTLEPTIAL